MIRRLLLLVLGLIALFWAARRLFRAGPRAEVPRRSTGVRDEGAMVRDRVCNTFLPRARALVTRVGDEEHYFCSEQCRSAFLARKTAEPR